MSDLPSAYAGLIVDDPVIDADRLRAVLARQARRHLRQSPPGRRRIVRLTVPLQPVAPFAWLDAQPNDFRLYWQGRDDDAPVAAAGTADVVTDDATTDACAALHVVGDRLDGADAAARYFGGLRFDPAGPADERWQRYGVCRFVLPRFELRQTSSAALLTCNLSLPDDAEQPERVMDTIAALRFPDGPLDAALPLPLSRDDAPGWDVWNAALREALAALGGADPLEKVVLARRATFRFDQPLAPFLLLQNLVDSTENCFHFGIQPAAGTAFVGASPERLLRVEGRHVTSEALAGTRPRAANPAEDRRLRDELLTSEKDRREHAFVVDNIRETLRRYCATLTADEAPSEMRLARSRHLYTGIRGTLRPGADVLDVLSALHPTPAVGGTPSGDALEAIRRLEPFDRGWYAGPVGWIGPDAAEFAVGLRSGLVRDRELSLFSGAGIVQGSVPEAEWDEIEYKIRNFVDVLGLEARQTGTNGRE